MRAYKVFAINNGTVIDHITAGCGLKVISILKLDKYYDVITVGLNLESKKLGKKDMIKIENKSLTKKDLDKIALVSPNTTINIIEKQKIAKKFNVSVPNELKGIIKCSNPQCITNHQGIITVFRRVGSTPARFRCFHCERSIESSDMQVI